MHAIELAEVAIPRQTFQEILRSERRHSGHGSPPWSSPMPSPNSKPELRGTEGRWVDGNFANRKLNELSNEELAAFEKRLANAEPQQQT